MGQEWAALFVATSLLLSLRASPSFSLKKSSGRPPASSSHRSSLVHRGSPVFHGNDMHKVPSQQNELEYDFYRDSCPKAEQIVRAAVKDAYSSRPSVAASLLRLAFHDCFIQGCDASVLLDSSGGAASEKDAIPNLTLRGFDVIDSVKSRVEEVCPGVVSCADILVLAARDGLSMAGGPFYPVLTGRKDSAESYHDIATDDLPAPDDELTQIISRFSSRGFSKSETVALLGAHNIGAIRCRFIQNRLYNFSGTGLPDASLGLDFLSYLRARCPYSSQPPSPSDSEASVLMGLNPSDTLRHGGFDNHFYRALVYGRGILHSDQQLMASHPTAALVEAYAGTGGGVSAFRRDFARAMVKMSGLGASKGRVLLVRRTCGRVDA